MAAIESCAANPFCENLNCSGSGVGYTELHFTVKKRDQESGLEYSGARYYGSTYGRFMSPDWSASPEPVPYADLDEPQTLNLYVYAGNNPLTRFNADGHNWFTKFLKGVTDTTYRPLVAVVEHPFIIGRAVGTLLHTPSPLPRPLRTGWSQHDWPNLTIQMLGCAGML